MRCLALDVIRPGLELGHQRPVRVELFYAWLTIHSTSQRVGATRPTGQLPDEGPYPPQLIIQVDDRTLRRHGIGQWRR